VEVLIEVLMEVLVEALAEVLVEVLVEHQELFGIQWINGQDNPADAMTKAIQEHSYWLTIVPFARASRIQLRSASSATLFQRRSFLGRATCQISTILCRP
jgi:hypothetical protein